MRHALPATCPPDHPARLGLDPARPSLLFVGKAAHLAQRLEAVRLVREAKVPSQQFPQLQDIDAKAPHYSPGLSKRAML